MNPAGLLKKFVEENHGQEIKELKTLNKQSKINIDYEKLNQFLLTESGKDFFQQQIYKFVEIVEEVVNDDTTPKNHISLKFYNIPSTHTLHHLDSTNNKEWISCKGMIKNITDIRVDLKEAIFVCDDCGKAHNAPVTDGNFTLPSMCVRCGCKKFSLDKDKSFYRNYRLIKLEEPLELRSGGATREFKVYTEDYLASPYHNIKAGDVVDVSGEFKILPKKVRGKVEGFEFQIDAHNIAPVDDAFEDYRLSEEDKEEIKILSQRRDIYQILLNTIAPEVYGYDTVKEALLLQLFEGSRPADDSIMNDDMDRWPLHILLIGDPGIGKSQLINSVHKRAPKSINIAGTNTSQAGLTTSAVKDELTGTWAMEAGAIILADTGLLIIDEYDKLSPTAQKALNEPMEQLSVSSAKAGLVQSMTARTSVLAAANPKYSRFTTEKTVKEQLDVPESNLSRFDLIFVLNDNIDKNKDESLADALLNKTFLEDNQETITDECFKKYVTYMKAHCFPVLEDSAKKLLTNFYVETRQAALHNNDGKPITARDLKALERLTIARSKSEGRTLATSDDAEDAIRIYTKALESVGLQPETAGELQSVRSDKEMSIIGTMEKMIRQKADFEGLPLSGETIKGLRIECGMLCHEKSISDDGIFDLAYENVKNSL